MPFKERTRGPWMDPGKTYSFTQNPLSLSYLCHFLLFLFGFLKLSLAKPRTEITGLGPPCPAPSLPFLLPPLQVPSTGWLSGTLNHLSPSASPANQPQGSNSYTLVACALLAFHKRLHDAPSHPSSLKISHLHDRCTSLLLNARQASLKQLVKSNSKLFTCCRASPLWTMISHDFGCLQTNHPRFLQLHILIPHWLWQGFLYGRHRGGFRVMVAGGF